MSKRKAILIAIFALVVILGAVGYKIFGKKAISLLPGGQLPQSQTGSTLDLGQGAVGKKAGDKITVGDVTTNNFYKQGKEADKQGDWLIVDKPEYQILYFEANSSFLISILKSPFPTVRPKAEAGFLTALAISKVDACKLNVTLTTPSFANPNESGKSYKLSFCE